MIKKFVWIAFFLLFTLVVSYRLLQEPSGKIFLPSIGIRGEKMDLSNQENSWDNLDSMAQAVVFEGKNKPLVLKQFALPNLGEGELLVKTTCSTICGSDLHTYFGRRTTATPTILGHEIIGEIVAFGADTPRKDYTGKSLSLGDRVTWSVARSCGECFYCEKGILQKCEKLFKFGHEKISNSHPLSGGVSNFCHLKKGTVVVKVPNNIPDHVACPANFATATVAGAMRVGGGCKGKIVLVQGLGMLGLTACAMADFQGAKAVIASDIDESRLEIAKRFGATHVVQAEGNVLSEVVDRISQGRGVDLAIELSGASSAMEKGIDLLGIGGTYVFVGAVSSVREIKLQPEKIVRKLLTISGLHNYLPEDLSAAVDFLSKTYKTYPFESLVPISYDLEDTHLGFEEASHKVAPRIAIHFND
jgi:putative phosphonate catabolism associated alcohol dehydrogenase